MLFSCVVGGLIAAFPGLYPNMGQDDWFVFAPIGTVWFVISLTTWMRNGAAYVEIKNDGVAIGKSGKERIILFSDLSRVGCHNGFIFLGMKNGAIVRLPLLYKDQSALFETLRMKVNLTSQPKHGEDQRAKE